MQASLPLQPQHSIGFRQYQIPPIIVTENMIIIGRVIKIERNLVEDWQP